MKFETFENKLLSWTDFKYKWFTVTILANWNGDWKTCLAYRWKTSYRHTATVIYKLLYWYELKQSRKRILREYFN